MKLRLNKEWIEVEGSPDDIFALYVKLTGADKVKEPEAKDALSGRKSGAGSSSVRVVFVSDEDDPETPEPKVSFDEWIEDFKKRLAGHEGDGEA